MRQVYANAIQTVIFKRTENSDYEYGFLLNFGLGKIVSLSGDMPDKVWDYKENSIEASVLVKFDENKIDISIRRKLK